MYGPLRFTRSDLVAMTIQRGRDFGLRSYTEVREALDLPPVKSFEDINSELNRTNPQVTLSLSRKKKIFKQITVNDKQSELNVL